MAGPEKRYNVAEVIAEARLKKPAIVLDNFPGHPDAEFRIDPPELWDDDVQDLAVSGQAEALGRKLLGDQYDAFKAAGGNNSLLNLVIESHSESMQLGESSASSDT